VIKLGELIMILELHRQGLSVSAITRQLRIDRKTVRAHSLQIAVTTAGDHRVLGPSPDAALARRERASGKPLPARSNSGTFVPANRRESIRT